MLTVEAQGDRGPILFLIHWLGGSARSWTEVSEQLATSGLRCVAVDLPGFGQSGSGQSGDDGAFSIDGMVQSLMETIRSVRGDETDAPWLLAGHSMGGKLAAIIARSAQQGEAGLENLAGLVLLSPSPPEPEPMEESKRQETLRALGPGTRERERRREHAAKFVDDNTGELRLSDAVRDRSIDDVLRMNPDALVAWMSASSKEDWSGRVGTVDVPALVMAGTEEQELGPEVQKKLTLRHLAEAQLVPLEGGGHLAPLERPFEVADRMVEFFRELGLEIEPAQAKLGVLFSALIGSDRTSPQTREVLLGRLKEKRAQGGVLGDEELRILRALVARVIPDAGFDLAGRLDGMLAQRRQDGWRFSVLPEDAAAWRQGLASLNAAAIREFGVSFIALHGAGQDELLQRARAGDLGKGLLGALHLGAGGDVFDAAQMRAWFEDVRGEMVKLYVADPRTMERIGFTGFADEAGFTQIRLGERDEVAV